jgi:hypothetical protein
LTLFLAVPADQERAMSPYINFSSQATISSHINGLVYMKGEWKMKSVKESNNKKPVRKA